MDFNDIRKGLKKDKLKKMITLYSYKNLELVWKKTSLT